MTKRNGGTVSPELIAAITAELKEVRRKEGGKFIYSATDRMRVYDRALKLEGLRLGAGGDDWGSAFGKQGDKSDET